MRTASSAEERAKAGEERQLYLSKLARRESRLADHNEHFLDRLRSVLPPDAAALCQDRFDVSPMRHCCQTPLVPTRWSNTFARSRNSRRMCSTQSTICGPTIGRRFAQSCSKCASCTENGQLILPQHCLRVVTGSIARPSRRSWGRMCDLNEQVVNQVLAVLPPGVSAGLSKEERGLACSVDRTPGTDCCAQLPAAIAAGDWASARRSSPTPARCWQAEGTSSPFSRALGRSLNLTGFRPFKFIERGAGMR